MQDVDEVLFLEALKKEDNDIISKWKKKIAFARMQFDEDCEERNLAWQERRQKREASAELDLRRMRLMLDMFAHRDGGSDAAGSSAGSMLLLIRTH